MSLGFVRGSDAQETSGWGTGETATDQPAGDDRFRLHAVRTDSPRATLSSLLGLREDLEAAAAAYREKRDSERVVRTRLIMEQLISLIDLSHLPAATSQQIGLETMAHVLDILGRVGTPSLDAVPDAAAFEGVDPAAYTIPGTPLRIIRIDEGVHSGEFLLSENTVRTAPRFYRGIEHLPLQTSLPIKSWRNALPLTTGPWIPIALVSAIPDGLNDLFLGTPIWKVVAVFALTLGAILLLVLWHRLLRSYRPQSRIKRLLVRVLSPISILVATLLLDNFIGFQINPTGQFSLAIDQIVTLVVYFVLAWTFWLAVLAFFEAVVLDPKFSDQSLDANMLRLIGRIIGLIGGMIILAYGAQNIGLPVFSVLAGLGIGGIAIALAIRPTFENLIGGFILYLDKPIRVGDFCTFSAQSGTIETIGIRSVQIRALDRTLISIPNAQFADMQIVNWAQCDQMLIDETIGLRYETDPDQLRYVLAKIREMFHAHPRIDNDTVRVRFKGYGASSLDISIRVYAKTREWNDFYAIKEDALLRISDIVKQSGTGFAFPSQTLYMARDGGLDEKLGAKARQEVSAWRRLRQLPFPRFAASRLKLIEDKLSYPPPGSPDFYATDEELAAGGERLSAEPLEEEEQKNPEPQRKETVAEDTERK